MLSHIALYSNLLLCCQIKRTKKTLPSNISRTSGLSRLLYGDWGFQGLGFEGLGVGSSAFQLDFFGSSQRRPQRRASDISS